MPLFLSHTINLFTCIAHFLLKAFLQTDDGWVCFIENFFLFIIWISKTSCGFLKTKSFDNIFFIHLNKPNSGVLGWPNYSNYSKAHLTSSLHLGPNRRIFLALKCQLSFRPWPSENTASTESTAKSQVTLVFPHDGV